MSPRKQIVLALVFSLFVAPISIWVATAVTDFESPDIEWYSTEEVLWAKIDVIVMEFDEYMKRSIENARQ